MSPTSNSFFTDNDSIVSRLPPTFEFDGFIFDKAAPDFRDLPLLWLAYHARRDDAGAARLLNLAGVCLRAVGGELYWPKPE